MTNAEAYLKHMGRKCPICESVNLEANVKVEIMGCIYQDVECLDCAATWRDVFKLETIDNLRPGLTVTRNNINNFLDDFELLLKGGGTVRTKGNHRVTWHQDRFWVDDFMGVSPNTARNACELALALGEE